MIVNYGWQTQFITHGYQLLILILNYISVYMKKSAIVLLICLCSFRFGFSQDSLSANQRLQWWREARFGMFIHWGVYAVPAGEFRGHR